MGDGCASLSFFSQRGASNIFPVVLVQRQSIELLATTVGEWRRRHSLRRHNGRFGAVRLTSFHHVLLQGGFLLCVRDDECTKEN